MKSVLAGLGNLYGLFVDDGTFAIEIMAVIVIATFVAREFPALHWAAGVILVVGCAGSLIEGVARTAQVPPQK